MPDKNVYDILLKRGFIYQCTDEEGLRNLLRERKISCYIGFDPTASSLHVGSLVPIMALVHMQHAGHRPLAIVGGGTAMVGDPSGKSEMRKMLSAKQIEKNAEGLKKQLSRYIIFEENKALMINNAQWLMGLNYIEFLRDVGVHFSVNRMLSAESYRIRLETGLSFLEFNYMLLQAYDFYILCRDWDCPLQMGGQDQWGNIVAGIDLIRRKLNKPSFGVTFPLITNASGEKFGKTVAGAVWLDKDKTPPFEFYQFWRNTEDADVERFLGLFTLLPIDEVKRLGRLKAPEINRAKEILAYEATKITHGKELAMQAYTSAVKQFGPADPERIIETSSDIKDIEITKEDIIPSTIIEKSNIAQGLDLVALMAETGIVSSKSEARRLIKQGGVLVNGERIESIIHKVREGDFQEGVLMIKVGKKRIHKVLAGE